MRDKIIQDIEIKYSQNTIERFTHQGTGNSQKSDVNRR